VDRGAYGACQEPTREERLGVRSTSRILGGKTVQETKYCRGTGSYWETGVGVCEERGQGKDHKIKSKQLALSWQGKNAVGRGASTT